MVLRQEGSDHGEHHPEQGHQGGPAISHPTLTIQSLPVHPDIPIGLAVNELDQPGDDSVQPVAGHPKLTKILKKKKRYTLLNKFFIGKFALITMG